MDADELSIRVTRVWYVPLYYCVASGQRLFLIDKCTPVDSSLADLGCIIYALAYWADNALDDPLTRSITFEFLAEILPVFAAGGHIDPEAHQDCRPELVHAFNLITAHPIGRSISPRLAHLANQIAHLAAQKRSTDKVSAYIGILRMESVTAAHWFSLPFTLTSNLRKSNFERFCRLLFAAGLYYDAAIDLRDDAEKEVISLTPSSRVRCALLVFALMYFGGSVLRYPQAVFNYYRRMAQVARAGIKQDVGLVVPASNNRDHRATHPRHPGCR